ncbi:MAG: hypothetical protein EPN19_07660 [Betaproteobacteria bacterium]|nr:MAG: hypothetical protein EPN19_07660 [Betaproteobacteria bacterium]
MRRILLPLALSLGACHAHTGVNIGPGTSGAAPGGSASIGIRAGAAAGALVGLGFAAAFISGQDEHRIDATTELDPTRRVVEQHCNKPIEDPAANLRCR